MYEIASKAPDIVEINIANYGKLVPAKNPRKNYTENLFLDEEEHAILQKIADLGIPANMQMTPTSEKVDLKKVL
jgi:mannose/fructose/N-acetylgalactosamine-specific phosphotransferase system component IIB